MAHFLNPESNVRISGTEPAVLVGRQRDVGLWGCDDFAGRELDVTSSGTAVTVEQGAAGEHPHLANQRGVGR